MLVGLAGPLRWEHRNDIHVVDHPRGDRQDLCQRRMAEECGLTERDQPLHRISLFVEIGCHDHGDGPAQRRPGHPQRHVLSQVRAGIVEVGRRIPLKSV